jgi:signal transduction histidine kinase
MSLIEMQKDLLQLADDILDVTKIESSSLRLKKETFHFKELITLIINEYNKVIEKSNKNIRLVYTSKE